MTNQLHKVQVDFSGLMEVLGKNLYSTPIVAIRELVQNAHDSCQRRRLEHDQPFEAQIHVKPDASAKVLIIEDRGAGLTEQEVIDYLATIGAGYTRKLRAQHQHAEGLIGAFGLGFLSAYVISDRVDVVTTSYQTPDQTWRFSTRTGEQFTLTREPENKPIGTQVILYLSEDFEDLCDAQRLHLVLERYCCLLPVPIYLGADSQPINHEQPPWEKSYQTQAQRTQEALQFAARFDRYYEPMATMSLPAQAAIELNGGLLWIQEGGNYATSDNRSVWVFVRGMLVSHDARELLPEWAGFAGALIACDGLTPTASREDLMRDERYHAIQHTVRDALIDGLERLSKQDPVTWRRILRRHNEALLGAALCDARLFALLSDELTLPTSEGDLRMGQLLQRDRRIHVTLYDQQGHEEVLFRALQKPIVDGMRYAAYPFVQHYAKTHNVPIVQLGTRAGQAALFPDVELRRVVRRGMERLFERDGFGIKLTQFEPSSLPAVLVYDRQVELKQRIEADETDKRISKAVLGLARIYTSQIDDSKQATLYVNLNSPLVEKCQAHLEAEASAQAASMIWSIAMMMAPGLNAHQQLEDALGTLNTHLQTLLFGAI